MTLGLFNNWVEVFLFLIAAVILYLIVCCESEQYCGERKRRLREQNIELVEELRKSEAKY